MMKAVRSLGLLAWMLAAWVGVAAGQDTGIRVKALPQRRLPVEAGQYSGIAFISGDQYAVVDDKLPGGGIVFFVLAAGGQTSTYSQYEHYFK